MSVSPVADMLAHLHMAADAYGDNDIGTTCRSAAVSIQDLYVETERLRALVESLEAEIALARSQGAFI